MESSYLASFFLMLAQRLVCLCGDPLKECALKKISPLGLFMLHSLLGHMNSSAGGTEGKLGSTMELYVEDSAEPCGQLELL